MWTDALSTNVNPTMSAAAAAYGERIPVWLDSRRMYEFSLVAGSAM